MKKYYPYIFGGLAVVLIVTSIVLRNGAPDVDLVITNLASTFMLFGGGLCVVVAVVAFFKRDDPEEW